MGVTVIDQAESSTTMSTCDKCGISQKDTYDYNVLAAGPMGDVPAGWNVVSADYYGYEDYLATICPNCGNALRQIYKAHKLARAAKYHSPKAFSWALEVFMPERMRDKDTSRCGWNVQGW